LRIENRFDVRTLSTLSRVDLFAEPDDPARERECPIADILAVFEAGMLVHVRPGSMTNAFGKPEQITQLPP
jgi:hypothetical protein